MEDKQGGRCIADGCRWCAFHFYIGLLKVFGLSRYGEKKLHDNTIWYVFGDNVRQWVTLILEAFPDMKMCFTLLRK